MSIQEPNLGIYTGYVTAESGWTAEFNANMYKLAFFAKPAVINRTLTVAPTTPANGDSYIIAAGATGTWAGKDKSIAVWRTPLSMWEYYAPSSGMQVVVLSESKMTTYLSAAWSAGITL